LRDVAADGSSRLTYREGDVCAVTGWRDGSLDSVEDWSSLYDDQAPARPALERQVLREGSAIRRWRIRQPDGGWRDVVMHMQRLSRRADGGGEIVGYLRDASAEQAALARAAAARAEMDETLALAPVVVFRARVWACAGCRRMEQGCFREDFVSRSIEAVTGWSPAALLEAGGLAAILLPADALASGLEAMRQEGRWSADLSARRPDGGTIAVRVTVAVVARVDDSAMDIVGYLADVTAERDAKARAITAARLASLGELSAGLAHELKQPLLAIGLALSNTQQAVERGDLAAVRTRLARASGYVQRAASVVEHLRRFARGADDGAPPVPVPVDQALEGALAVLGGSLRDGGVQLRVSLGDPAPMVLGQQVPLEQVLVNLIGNARDALANLPPDTPRRVRVSAMRDGDVVAITIDDNAGGIPDAVMARLFQPFVTTKAEDKGTGLGLSVCQGLVQQMGGTIEATNEARDGETGAVFRIRLPAAA
ncbi:MAG: GHKL domain-containing protein, partial [Roseomonas sp.]|nr:GHKL domain-containing protein [Roseomonas sp.]